ncbi:MAG: Nicotinate-nucleotide adenylyltransferase [Candidatus Anoxychlamydiales bacterium]|nr:Nicotinate-nucleotide adenylyltransferase [Candidatus Anoxychlamydiales bacterium]
MTIGLFTGTFDPIHNAHINLVIEMLEKASLKKIIVCPSKLSPFKMDKKPIASDMDRYNMVKLAFQNIKEVEVSDFELKNEAPSYTINTILEFKKSNDLKLILTEDMLLSLHEWKDYKKILEFAPLLVGCRQKKITSFQNNYFTLSKNNFIQTNIFEISASAIRERLSNKKYIYSLTPKEIMDYIHAHKLYY